MAAEADDLLARFREGDTHAFELLFARNRQRLGEYVMRQLDPQTRHRLPATDVVSETHARALDELDSFNYGEELSFFFWLCGLARDVAVEHMERLHRDPTPLSRLGRPWHGKWESDDLLGAIAGGDKQLFDEICSGDGVHLIALALGVLPDRRREAVVLNYIEGLDSAESASRLSIEPSHFHDVASRALVQLQQVLGDLLGE